MLWVESGGTGSRTVLLLHGLGATAAVWTGVRTALERRGDLCWVAADLPGHGRSAWEPGYSVGSMAARLAADLGAQTGELFIVGHSLGAYLALALASGWFKMRVVGVLGIGPKISWSQAELQGAQELAARPVRDYPSAEEAWTRYRRVSGLGADIAPATEVLAAGITQVPGGWRLAQDPRTFAVAGAPFGSLAASATGRIMLARGAGDPMVSLAELRQHAPRARELAHTGHNAHVEAPGAVLALLDELLADA
ncbi:MAG TPA: alpha/beta fold hydrolase [Steroidobacteraceae bacterium]|nr:alpha/beta fold hydrolase [Steroidobacteraceae bacterium]